MNHSDQVPEKELALLEESIRKDMPQNCKGILRTIGINSVKTKTETEFCPICHADGYIRKRKFICDKDPNHVTDLNIDNGLENLISATLKLLPSSAKDCFLHSQKSAITERKCRAREVVLEFMKKVSNESFFRKRTICVYLGEMLSCNF